VVVVNVSRWRCDALIVRRDGVTGRELAGLTLDEAAARANRYLSVLSDAELADLRRLAAQRPKPGRRPRDAVRRRFAVSRDLEVAHQRVDEMLADLLVWMWHAVAEPVLDELGYTETPGGETATWSRVWWCPTGPFTILPLHTTGQHRDRGEGRTRAHTRTLGPVLSHPAGDRPLVTLDGAAGGALQAVVQPVAQQLPDVAGMVADPGELLDHAGDAGKGPVVGVEAVRAGTLPERLVDGVQLLVGQARGVPGRAGAAQRLGPALAPLGVPATDILPGHPEGAGDLGLGVAGGKQRTSLHADAFERLAVAQTTGVAAVGGWSHTAILPGQPPILSSEGANLF
jgi:hypothetical protein